MIYNNYYSISITGLNRLVLVVLGPPGSGLLGRVESVSQHGCLGVPTDGGISGSSYYYYYFIRIISVEGTKAVINSTITPNMTFTKTSQKFGQWSDVR